MPLKFHNDPLIMGLLQGFDRSAGTGRNAADRFERPRSHR